MLAVQVVTAFGAEVDQLPRAAATNFLRADEVIMITYGNSVQLQSGPHLPSLGRFLSDHLADVFSTIHVLPFFPSSSDGGFAVVDFYSVAESLGTWKDLGDTGGSELMVDLVCNHGSAQSEWFAEFVADSEPGRSMFKTASPSDDLSMVVRPRTHPLLLAVDTAAGQRHVWVTFSEDQADFDFANPAVLIEFCKILGTYVQHGATRIRLDAIAYLWKTLGTRCIHLPETHEIVKLMRSLVETYDPHILLITETNVPHHDNVSYFGEGDEAHVVYNFTLAPLIVWSLMAQRSDVLTTWLQRLDPPPPGCAFLNFLASHDGIGLRPIEDLIAPDELNDLAEAVYGAGGDYSSYSTPTGERPYELNVSLVDLLAGSSGETAPRFLVAHALMLALQGIPALYVHSVLVSPGDTQAVVASGHKRDINRASLSYAQAEQRVSSGWRGATHRQLVHMVRVRRAHADFGPEAPQEIVELDPSVVAIRRGPILAIHNVTDRPVALTHQLPAGGPDWDLIAEERFGGLLAPWQAVWLAPETKR